MKSFKKPAIALLMLIMMCSCAKVYYSPNAFTLAHSHKLIAIAPPTVSIAARRKVDANALLAQQKTESLNFQKLMYGWMLKRKSQGKIKLEIQNVDESNSKLIQAGYQEKPFTPSEMCEILGVDGLLTSNYALTKPMSDGGAMAVGIFFGVWGATNEVNVSMSIQDAKTKTLIWNYDHRYSGSLGSNPSRLVNGLMRNASRKMPYAK